jgi:dihydrofolate reductase
MTVGKPGMTGIFMKQFSIIVAFDSQYGIGKNGQLAWALPSDLKHFKEITTAVTDPAKKNALIMGRKTWETLPEKFRPLAGRVNLVLSREGRLDLPSGVLCAKSLEDALNQLSSNMDSRFRGNDSRGNGNDNGIENIFVIGGAQIYAQAIGHPLCQKLYVTHVKGEHGCDTFFPPISKVFFPISASPQYQEEGISFHYSVYLRS